MLSVYDAKQDCCGCSACHAACPTGAITMLPDEEGFLYPAIDTTACADCGACRDVCPFIAKDHYKEAGEQHYYVAKHRSPDVLMKSTSGGAFSALSDVVLAQGGAIYGADFDENFRVVHTRADTPEARNRQRISKYVQSDMGSTFRSARADLEAGLQVLFTGTPCQCAGLRGYLGHSPLDKGLTTCDLICHSIPSPLVWENYKALLVKEAGGRLVDLRFRSKVLDWDYMNADKTFFYRTDTMPEAKQDNRFYFLYFRDRTIMRSCCAVCPFADARRASDITIADYWGIEKYAPDWYDPKGVSVIITNDKKGEALMRQSEGQLVFEERPAEETLSEQRRLHRPIRFAGDRDAFWQDYRERGLGPALEARIKKAKR